MTTKGLAKFIKDRDIYGLPIKVLYRGEDQYKTKLGAFCTLATYILALINLLELIQVFFNGNRQ